MKRNHLQKIMPWMLSLGMITSYIPVSQGMEIPDTEPTTQTAVESAHSSQEFIHEVEDVPVFMEHTGIFTTDANSEDWSNLYSDDASLYLSSPTGFNERERTTEASPIYTITLDATTNGGTISSNTIETGVWSTLDSLPDPDSRSGYTFNGWFTAEKDGDNITTETQFSTDTTIYAQWESNTDTVKFHHNDTNNTEPSEEVDYKVTESMEKNLELFRSLSEKAKTFSITLVSATGGTLDTSTLTTGTDGKLTQTMLDDVDKTPDDGYSFKGWYTTETGSSKLVLDYQCTEDTTIYAQWEKKESTDKDNTFTVTLDSATGGTLDTNSLTTKADGLVTEAMLDNVGKTPDDGYQFKGWYTTETGSTELVLDYLCTEDTTIFAQWEKKESTEEDKTFTITLVSTTGGSLNKTSLTTGTDGKLTQADFASVVKTASSGYTFKGWFTSATGSTEISLETSYSADTTIYAQWEKTTSTEADKTFTITLESAAGGTLNKTSLTTGTDGKLTQATLDTVTKTPISGYSFKGWFTSATGSTEISLNTVYSSNTTIYAQWTKDPVESKIYNVNLKSMAGGSLDKTYLTTGSDGKLTQASLDSVTKTPSTGYSFKGWYTSSSGTQAISLSTVYTKETDIYAFWETTAETKDTFTIAVRSTTGGSIGSTYYLETNSNGTLSASDLLKITEELTATTGYTFDAWYKSQTSTYKVTSSTVFTEDSTIYARWIPDEYNVYFNNQGHVTAQVVSHNTVASRPTDPVREGYIFLGWYHSGIEWYFSTKITGSITLTAMWAPETAIPPSYDYDGSGIPGLTPSPTVHYNNKLVVMPFGTASALPAYPTMGNLITITPEQGKIVEFVMVVTSLGQEIPVTRTDEGNYWFHQPGIAVTINVVYQEAFPFLDVGDKDYYYEAIHQLYTNGLLGYNTNYYPDIPVDRSTVATMLYMLDGSPITQYQQIYDDVHYTDSFGVPVTWANKFTIFVGYEDGLFRPYTAITRQDLALVLSRYAEKEGVDVSTNYKYTNSYYDNYQISQYALESLNWAIEEDLLVQTGSQNIDPTGETSRGDYALTLYEFKENILN